MSSDSEPERRVFTSAMLGETLSGAGKSVRSNKVSNKKRTGQRATGAEDVPPHSFAGRATYDRLRLSQFESMPNNSDDEDADSRITYSSDRSDYEEYQGEGVQVDCNLSNSDESELESVDGQKRADSRNALVGQKRKRHGQGSDDDEGSDKEGEPDDADKVAQQLKSATATISRPSNKRPRRKRKQRTQLKGHIMTDDLLCSITGLQPLGSEEESRDPSTSDATSTSSSSNSGDEANDATQHTKGNTGHAADRKLQKAIFPVRGVSCVGCMLGARLMPVSNYIHANVLQMDQKSLFKMAAHVYKTKVAAPCKKEGVQAPQFQWRDIKKHYTMHSLDQQLSRAEAVRTLHAMRLTLEHRGLVKADEEQGLNELDKQSADLYMRILTLESKERQALGNTHGAGNVLQKGGKATDE